MRKLLVAIRSKCILRDYEYIITRTKGGGGGGGGVGHVPR